MSAGRGPALTDVRDKGRKPEGDGGGKDAGGGRNSRSKSGSSSTSTTSTTVTSSDTKGKNDDDKAAPASAAAGVAKEPDQEAASGQDEAQAPKEDASGGANTGGSSWSHKLSGSSGSGSGSGIVGLGTLLGEECKCLNCTPENGGLGRITLQKVVLLMALPCIVHYYYYLYERTTREEELTDFQKLAAGLGFLALLIVVQLALSLCRARPGNDEERREYEEKAREYGFMLLMSGTLFGFLLSVAVVRAFIIGNDCHYCGKARQ